MFGDLPENSSTNGLSLLVNKIFKNSRKNVSHDIELSSSDTNAVVVKSAFKSYGRLGVLHDLNMEVAKGTIYGLLGASGCGKTTLLGCILGIKRLNSGDVCILGEEPEARNESRIGYMPQVTGLYGDFTVMETLLFFGRVIGMDESKIRDRSKYLVDLLMLPSCDQSVKNLSGGQQRRVSLAVALLHEPELLILDEPTVGVDCILRKLIWDHFIELTANGRVTVIITTHYIEEARQANRIGIMRGGCLLVESDPDHLIKRHQAKTLEEVFLVLSTQQNQCRGDVSTDASRQKRPLFEGCTLESRHMKALTLKNVLWLRKNPSILIIMMVLPVVMVSLFCVVIGHAPVDLAVAVVNLEPDSRHCKPTPVCGSKEASCTFLGYLEDRGLVLRYFAHEEVAIESVRRGVTYASIVIEGNFSRDLHARTSNWQTTIIPDSNVNIFRDLSNKHLSTHLQVILYQTYQQFFYDYVESCGLRWKLMKVPIKWETVYGEMIPNFTDFSIPGVLLSIFFIVGVILTAYAMLIERNEASLERSLAMGVSKVELLAAHVVVEYAIMCTQIVLTMMCAFLGFEMTLKGSLLLTTALLMLSGLCGICYGLFLSCVTNSQIAIALGAIGSYLAVVLTNGLFWPTEAMHWLLKPFALLFPLTKPTETLRNIMHRGWGLFQSDVYAGFVSVIIWSVVLLLLSVIVNKVQRS